jgi:hypothetical protein
MAKMLDAKVPKRNVDEKIRQLANGKKKGISCQITVIDCC